MFNNFNILFASNSLSNYRNTFLTELVSELPPKDETKSFKNYKKEEIEPLLKDLDTVESIKEDPFSATLDPSSVTIDPSSVTFDPSSVTFAPSSVTVDSSSVIKKMDSNKQGIVGRFVNDVFHIVLCFDLINK